MYLEKCSFVARYVWVCPGTTTTSLCNPTILAGHMRDLCEVRNIVVRGRNNCEIMRRWNCASTFFDPSEREWQQPLGNRYVIEAYAVILNIKAAAVMQKDDS